MESQFQFQMHRPPVTCDGKVIQIHVFTQQLVGQSVDLCQPLQGLETRSRNIETEISQFLTWGGKVIQVQNSLSSFPSCGGCKTRHDHVNKPQKMAPIPFANSPLGSVAAY